MALTVKEMIVATEKHDSKTKLETYFNDLDMSILNAPIEHYKVYSK
jgi:predicted metal-dependent HD superfamily phosphohydrolase